MRLLLPLLLLLTGAASPAWGQDAAPPQPGKTIQSHASTPQLGRWEALLRREKIAGVVDVSLGGKAALHYSLGVDRGERSAGVDSVFWIGSISKQFVAAAVLRLVDKGQIKLDAPVSAYLPLHKLAKDPLTKDGQHCTVRHLLSHTCGLPGGSGLCPSLHLEQPHNRARFLACVARTSLLFRPGTAHRYANLGTDLAGVLVATVSKQPYGEFLQRAFFRPLGMTSTGSDDLVGRRDLLSRLVQGQLVVFGALISTANWLRLDPLGPGYRGPSGNLHSTARDLHRWNFALHGGKVLSETSYRAMVTPVREGYGLGIAVRSYVGHNNPSQNNPSQNNPSKPIAYWHNGALIPMNWSAHLAYVPTLAASVVVLTARNMKRSRMDAVGFGIVATLLNSTPATLPPLKTMAGALDLIFYVLPLLLLACLFFTLIQFLRGPSDALIPWSTGVLAACGVAITLSNSLDFYGQHTLMGSLFALLPSVGLLLHHKRMVALRQALLGPTADRRAGYILVVVVFALGWTSKGMGRLSILSMAAFFVATATAIVARDAMGGGAGGDRG